MTSTDNTVSEQNASKLPAHFKVGVAALLCLCYAFLCSVTVPLHGQDLDRVMPAVITNKLNDSLLTTALIDEAAGLALTMTGRYAYIPVAVRDSVLLSKNGKEWSAAYAAKEIGANTIAYVSVSRIINLIRVELTLMSGRDYTVKQTGVGYASMRHAVMGTERPALQPALLLASQRAVLEAVRQPDIYASLQSDLRARPATLYGVSGIAFRQDSSIMPMWQLFDENTVVSYDMAQTIVHRLHDRDSLVVVDIETRDTMYAMGRLFLVENDRAISRTELRILRGFDIANVITGTFERVPEGGRLTLYASHVDRAISFTVNRSATRTITTDSVEAMRDAVNACIDELFP